MQEISIFMAGEQGMVIEFGNVIDRDINARVHQLAKTIVNKMPDDVLEVIPTYRSLMVYFNPLHITRKTLEQQIMHCVRQKAASSVSLNASRVVTIPVCYGNQFGPDIEFVAQHNKLSVGDVIEIHTAKPYQVYMLGFTPGFPYLGGMCERIATPRLEKPRVKIPAGSVGIGGTQTGIYPVDSPGGWQLIGQTPLQLFSPSAPSPFLFAAGDYLQFQSIDPDHYLAVKQRVTAGSYQPVTRILDEGAVEQ